MRLVSLLRFSFSSEFHPAFNCRRLLATIAFLGVSFSFAILVWESTYRWGSHTHLRFALSVSHTLDELLLPAPCGPISSHYHVRDFSSGVSPDTQPDKLSHCRTFLSLTSRATFRLQGLYRCADPLYLRRDLAIANTRSPHEFQLLQVFICTPGRRLHASPLLTFSADASL